MLCCFNICAAFSGIPYTYVYVWPINNYGLWWQMFMQRSYKCIKINWLKKSEVSGYCGLIAGWYLSTDGFTYWSASSSPVCGEKFHFLLYTERIMFYLCYILVYFFSLLALTSDEYFMSSWEYGVILTSRDWIHCFVPLFRVDGEIAPNFAKNLTVPLFADLS